MRHQKSGRRLNRDTDARKALMRNLCSSLLQNGRITTTEAKAKELRRWVDRLITTARGGDVEVVASGRTDAGAHALGQVVNFRLDRLRVDRVVGALNALLPEDVSALSAEVVDDSFHARYSARWRRYGYRYLDRRARPAL